ncbi:4Fe-4S dicluster domain-containing protein [Slackia heliotrinireducens]|uniref:4Fe-4S dicluster domain-containing protein n=1 Tax=Slackia heliotrinireducens TaxID=84110 RepID=UPI003314C81F
MHSMDLSSVSADDIRACQAIADEAGIDLKDCYQCGKCTAGCPLAESMDLMPREVIRYLQLGAIDTVLESKTPWICAQCSVCSSRCPQGVDICSTMRAVRLAAKHAGKRPVPEADIFDDEFIANVRSHGVSNEQYLAAAYNLKSGHLMQDMGNATRMLKRRMVGPAMHNIKGKADVAALIDRALAADEARRKASDASQNGEAQPS